MTAARSQPAWTPCECGEFWCRLHECHAFECACPPIEEWEIDPYVEGGPPARAPHAKARRGKVSLVIVLALLAFGCVHHPRFLIYHARISPNCTLSLIQDQRTAVCLAVFRCAFTAPSMIRVPEETCEP